MFKCGDPGPTQEEKKQRGSQAVAEGLGSPDDGLPSLGVCWYLLCVPKPLVPPFAVLPGSLVVSSVLAPWARVVVEQGRSGAVVHSGGALLRISFPPFIPNVPSCLSLLSQALSPVIWCPVFFERCCGFIVFSTEVTQGKAAHQGCDCI